MRLIPHIHVPIDHIGSRVVHTGASLGTAMAYLIIGLMLLTMIADTCLTIIRAYSC